MKTKVPSHSEVEQWHLIDKCKVADWLEEMFKKERERIKQSKGE